MGIVQSKHSRYQAEVIIYTDGGARPNPGYGAWAAVFICNNPKAYKEIYGSEKNTTNNRMEMTAVIRALETLKFPCRVDIYTDSSYIVDAFNRGWVDRWFQGINLYDLSEKNEKLCSVLITRPNADLWLEMLRLVRRHQVHFNWVKGHSGLKFNERCDELVRKATEELILRDRAWDYLLDGGTILLPAKEVQEDHPDNASQSLDPVEGIIPEEWERVSGNYEYYFREDIGSFGVNIKDFDLIGYYDRYLAEDKKGSERA